MNLPPGSWFLVPYWCPELQLVQSKLSPSTFHLESSQMSIKKKLETAQQSTSFGRTSVFLFFLSGLFLINQSIVDRRNSKKKKKMLAARPDFFFFQTHLHSVSRQPTPSETSRRRSLAIRLRLRRAPLIDPAVRATPCGRYVLLRRNNVLFLPPPGW